MDQFLKWAPEVGAIAAACVIGYSTGMAWWQMILLWLALDLMTTRGGKA